MTPETWFVFALIGAAVIAFASDRVRLDLVAIVVLLALLVSGILTTREALAGFGDSVVILIAALFVVGEGLVRTGVAYSVGDWLMRIAGDSETRMIALLMLCVGGIGAFMSSTGIVAIFIPIVLSIASKTGIARERLLMPLASAAMISGMMTLIATPPNLVASAALSDAKFEPFGFFDFSLIGFVVLLAAIVYMLLAGRFLLSGDGRQSSGDDSQTLLQLAEAYQLHDQFHRLRVPHGSALTGKTIAELKLRTRFNVMLIGIERQGRFGADIAPALVESRIADNDVLYVIGHDIQIDHFIETHDLARLSIDLSLVKEVTRELGVAEVALAPESKLIGKTIEEAGLRSRHKVTVLAIRRKGIPMQAEFATEKLQFGDILFVSGGWKHISRLQVDKRDFFVLSLPIEINDVAPARQHAPKALAILVAMIAMMAFGVVPSVTAALFAALAMIAAGCVTMDAAYKCINWPSMVLIAGMLPLATALANTGGTAVIVNGLIDLLGNSGPVVILIAIFLLTSVVGLFISNTATAVLVAPIAIDIAVRLDVSPYTFAMAVAIGASTGFSTPVSSPVNTLVLAPGNYGFKDFVKVGAPLQFLAIVVGLGAILVLFPL
jgi:di/tricarboxylate transporter